MTALVFEKAAAQARHFRWVERRLFEILGGWVPTVSEPEGKLLLRSHSFQHAWHADLWEALLPVGEDPGPAGVAGPVPQTAEALAPALTAIAAAEGTVERLVGTYRVILPRLIGAYRVATMGGVDAPTARTLRLILADDVPAWQEGEALIQAVLGSEAEVAAAASHMGRVEPLVVAAGGIEIH